MNTEVSRICNNIRVEKIHSFFFMIFTKIDRIIIVTLSLFLIFFNIYENLYIIGYFTTNMKYINN